MNEPRRDGPVTIAMLAGEASGDQLGAALIKALKVHFPDARFVGVGSHRMRAAGFDAWRDSEELAVMGLVEVLRHLPGLLRLRRYLRERLLQVKPDIFIGIDSPDFNLGLEKQVRARGLTTAHYVSPTVWAWRQGRAKKIGRSADMVLCLFPFEPGFYQEHAVPARYTGHPMADAIPLESDPLAAREALGLPVDGLQIALLPGSRMSEVSRLAGPLLDAAETLAEQHPGARFLVPLATDKVRVEFSAAMAGRSLENLHLVDGRSLEVMTAADVVVCASGTAALECMLVNRPMVVVYVVAAMSKFIFKDLGFMKSQWFSLPNVLAGEQCVPELTQKEVNGPGIAREVNAWLDDPERRRLLSERFQAMHRELRIGAAASAAQVIADMLNKQGISDDTGN